MKNTNIYSEEMELLWNVFADLEGGKLYLTGSPVDLDTAWDKVEEMYQDHGMTVFAERAN